MMRVTKRQILWSGRIYAVRAGERVNFIQVGPGKGQNLSNEGRRKHTIYGGGHETLGTMAAERAQFNPMCGETWTNVRIYAGRAAEFMLGEQKKRQN